MRIAIFSDIQIHNYAKFNEGDSRLDNCIACFEEIITSAMEQGINTFFFAGDLFDSPKAVPTIVIDKFVFMFAGLRHKNPDFEIYCISGNHDQPFKYIPDKHLVNSIEIVRQLYPDNFHIVNEGYMKLDRDTVIWGIPYIRHINHFWEILESFKVDTKLNNYLMIHQTPKGTLNMNIPHEVDPEHELFQQFDYVFAGHIHEYQHHTHNFVMVGSPLHRDLSDVGQDKGYLIFDTVDNKYQRVILDKYPKFSYKPLEKVTGEEKDFIIPTIEVEKTEEDTELEQNFAINKNPKELIQIYWEHNGDGDKELLEIGLKAIS